MIVRTVAVYCDGCGVEHLHEARSVSEMQAMVRRVGWHLVAPCWWFCPDCWSRGKRIPTTHVAGAHR